MCLPTTKRLNTALVYLKRYLPTLPQADIYAIPQILRTTAFAQRRSTGPLTQPSRKNGLVKNFKLAMKASREANAIEHLRTRTTTTWSSAPSFLWLQALTNLHPRLCGAIPRYALLRWAIGGESDGAFWKRFHKLGYCVCGCGKIADTYPQGLAQAPLAEHHYAEYINPPAHIHPEYDFIAQHTLLPQIYTKVRQYEPVTQPKPTHMPTTKRPQLARSLTAPLPVSCVVKGTTAWTIGCGTVSSYPSP